MKNKLLQNTLVAAVAVASIGQALADGGKIVTHRDLAQTKAKVIHLAEQSLYPLSAMNAEDVRATVAGIQSPKAQGYGKQATAEMFVVGGQGDTLVPTSDLLDVLAMPGGIKEAWINPTGIHMGRDRQRGLLDADIHKGIVVPWLIKKLAVKP